MAGKVFVMNPSDIELSGKPSDSVREIENQDGAVLLDIQQGLCFSINTVGARIWRMMKQEQSFAQIVDTLVEEFNLPLIRSGLK